MGEVEEERKKILEKRSLDEIWYLFSSTLGIPERSQCRRVDLRTFFFCFCSRWSDLSMLLLSCECFSTHIVLMSTMLQKREQNKQKLEADIFPLSNTKLSFSWLMAVEKSFGLSRLHPLLFSPFCFYVYSCLSHKKILQHDSTCM